MEQSEIYLIKALDAFECGEMEEAHEKITYALSHNPESAAAHYLLGKLSQKYLGNYGLAIEHYENALKYNPQYMRTYFTYIDLLIILEQYSEAERVIRLGLNVTGLNTSKLYVKKAKIFEKKKEYNKAIELLKQAQYESLSDSLRASIDNSIDRIKDKKKYLKKINMHYLRTITVTEKRKVPQGFWGFFKKNEYIKVKKTTSNPLNQKEYLKLSEGEQKQCIKIDELRYKKLIEKNQER